MKLILLAVLLVAASGPSNASDVGVSVSIGQTGRDVLLAMNTSGAAGL